MKEGLFWKVQSMARLCKAKAGEQAALDYIGLAAPPLCVALARACLGAKTAEPGSMSQLGLGSTGIYWDLPGISLGSAPADLLLLAGSAELARLHRGE
jgi:hypothetical protein